MNRNRPMPRDRMRDRGGRSNYGIGGDGLLGEGPSPGGAGPLMGANPLGLRDTQLALAQSLLQQQQLVNAGFGATGNDFGSLGALAGGMHFLQQQQQQQMRTPMVGGMGGMSNDRKRSGGQLKRETDQKRGRRDSWGRGERDRSYGSNSRSGQDRDRNRSSRWESDKDKKKHGEDYDPAEPTEDDVSDEGGAKGNSDSNLYCHVCGVSVYDEESFQRHLNGLKHKARMESIATVHQMRSTQLKSRMKAEEHLRNIERKGGRDPDYFCKICNNDLAIPWEKHRYSNIHKQRLLQVRKGCGWCKVHDFTNFTEVLEHRETEEHKKNSDLYGKKDEDKDRRHSKDGKERERTRSSSERSRKSEERKDEDEEEEEEDLTIPEYNADVPVGLDYVIPVTGYFCKLCHKFYNKKSARATHCQTTMHYEKFKEALEVKIAAREKKREEERLRKEREAEEALEAMEEDQKEKEGEESQEENNHEEEKEGSVNEDQEGDKEDDEQEAMEDDAQDDGILDEEGVGNEEEEEDQFDNEPDLSGSAGDEGLNSTLTEDASIVNTTAGNETMDSSSFVYVSGDVAQEQVEEKSTNDKESADLLDQDVELVEASNGKDEAADDSLADVVTSELSQTSLNPEEADDDLDLSVTEDNPAITTSTPVVAEEAPATVAPTPPTTRGKGTARRGRGRGRSKK